MLLINCKNNFILTFSVNCVISEGNRVTAFAIIDTKLYIPAATLQRMIIPNHSKNWNQDSIAQLTGINIIKSNNRESKPVFRLLNWSNFSGSKETFCFIIWR